MIRGFSTREPGGDCSVCRRIITPGHGARGAMNDPAVPRCDKVAQPREAVQWPGIGEVPAPLTQYTSIPGLHNAA